MKYFNRHKCMSVDTLKKIGESTTELFSVDGSHEDMNIIKSEKMDLYEKILNICKDIDTYPKYEYDVTEH